MHPNLFLDMDSRGKQKTSAGRVLRLQRASFSTFMGQRKAIRIRHLLLPLSLGLLLCYFPPTRLLPWQTWVFGSLCLPMVLGEWPLPICSFQRFLELPSEEEMSYWPPSPCLCVDLTSLVSWSQSQKPPWVGTRWRSAVWAPRTGRAGFPPLPAAAGQQK